MSAVEGWNYDMELELYSKDQLAFCKPLHRQSIYWTVSDLNLVKYFSYEL